MGWRTYVNVASTLVDGKTVPMFRKGSKWNYEYFKKVSWLFKSVSFADWEFINDKWATVKTRNFELILQDGEMQYYVTGNLRSWLGRAIFNKLSSQEELGVIEIELYLNKSWFFSAEVKNDWRPMEWKIQRPEQDELISKTEVDDKIVKWYKKLNEAIEKNVMLVYPKNSLVDELLAEVKPDAEHQEAIDQWDLPF